MQAIVILQQISNTYSTGSEAPADVLLPPMQPRKNSRCKQFITKNVAKQADIGNNLFLFLELRISPPLSLSQKKKLRMFKNHLERLHVQRKIISC